MLDLTLFDERFLHIRSTESQQAVTLLHTHFFQTYCIENTNGVFVVFIIPWNCILFVTEDIILVWFKINNIPQTLKGMSVSKLNFLNV